MELPSAPWQAAHVCASFAPAATSSWQKTGPERAPRRRRNAMLRNRAPFYGRLNTNTLLPRFASIWLLPPAATATYCLPPTMYDTAGALTPAPQLYFHSSLPVFESKALNHPFASPLKTRPPAVARTPPISGCGVLCFQATLPVSRFTATSCPHCSSLGITLNAPPSHSLPPG